MKPPPYASSRCFETCTIAVGKDSQRLDAVDYRKARYCAGAGGCPHGAPASKQHGKPVFNALDDAQTDGYIGIVRKADQALAAEHFPLALSAVLVKECPVNANRCSAEGFGHQGNNGTHTIVPPERMREMTQHLSVEVALLVEIAFAPRAAKGGCLHPDLERQGDPCRLGPVIG